MLIFKVQIGRANSNSKATMDHIYDQMILPDLCVDTKYGFNQRVKENNFLVLYMERKSKLNKNHVLTQASQTLKIRSEIFRSNTNQMVSNGYHLVL